MPLHARILGTYTIQTVSGVTQTFTTNFDALDLSRLRSLQAQLSVSAAASSASDTLDVKIQDTLDGTWGSRLRFLAVAGNQSASAGTPYVQRYTIENAVDLQSGERGYVPSGSASGSDLAAGTVLNGPFPPRYRTALGPQPAWRVVAVQTNASGTALFTATVTVLGQEWDT